MQFNELSLIVISCQQVQTKPLRLGEVGIRKSRDIFVTEIKYIPRLLRIVKLVLFDFKKRGFQTILVIGISHFPSSVSHSVILTSSQHLFTLTCIDVETTLRLQHLVTVISNLLANYCAPGRHNIGKLHHYLIQKSVSSKSLEQNRLLNFSSVIFSVTFSRQSF